MQDLIDKLAFVKSELLGRMSLGDFMREWILNLSRYLIHIFLLHASIVRPLGESGKLKLTGDMTELEMGISSLLTTGQLTGARSSSKSLKLDEIGDEYFALRSFRTILFSELNTLANPVETVHLPPLVVLHHIIVLSPLRLPHEVHGWSEVEYVLWVLKHQGLEDQLGLLEKAVEDQLGGEGRDKEDGEEEKRGRDGKKDEVAKAKAANGSGAEDEEVYVRLIREVLGHARAEVATPGAA